MMKSDVQTTRIARHRPPARSGTAMWPWSTRVVRRLHGLIDRLIAGSSLVSTAPVLDVRDFAWTATLRRNWVAIRDEARAVMRADDGVRGGWQPLTLWDCGGPVGEYLARFPRTRAVIARVPGLSYAGFAVLAPGVHIPARRGSTKGLITCHLALSVPRDGDIRMRVHNRVMRWAEGETLVFDDTFDHEVWNDTCGAQVVLLIRFERPLRRTGKWLAALTGRSAARTASATMPA